MSNAGQIFLNSLLTTSRVCIWSILSIIISFFFCTFNFRRKKRFTFKSLFTRRKTCWAIFVLKHTFWQLRLNQCINSIMLGILVLTVFEQVLGTSLRCNDRCIMPSVWNWRTCTSSLELWMYYGMTLQKIRGLQTADDS